MWALEHTMTNEIYVAYGLVNLALTLLCLRWFRPLRPVHLGLMAIGAALAYDNLMLGLGASFGVSARLEALSYWRYVLHVFLSPLICLVAGYLLSREGPSWLRGKRALALGWASTAGFILWGYLHDLRPIQLGVRLEGELLSYGPVVPMVPVVIISANVVVIAMAILLWRSAGYRTLALTSLAMFFAGAMQPVWGALPTNAGEALFLWGFMASIRDLVQRPLDAELSARQARTAPATV